MIQSKILLSINYIPHPKHSGTETLLVEYNGSYFLAHKEFHDYKIVSKDSGWALDCEFKFLYKYSYEILNPPANSLYPYMQMYIDFQSIDYKNSTYIEGEAELHALCLEYIRKENLKIIFDEA